MNQINDNKAGIQEKIDKYKSEVEILIKYLPWLEQTTGKMLQKSISADENNSHALMVPVYDSTLLGFIKTCQKTKFMNRNYVYTYSKYRLRTAEDEIRLIEKTQIMEMEVLGDILSRYVMKGMQKGTVWSDGIKDGVFLKVVSRMKELIEFWTVPM